MAPPRKPDENIKAALPPVDAASVGRRTAEQVINAAIAENRIWEWMCFGSVLAFGIVLEFTQC